MHGSFAEDFGFGLGDAPWAEPLRRQFPARQTPVEASSADPGEPSIQAGKSSVCLATKSTRHAQPGQWEIGVTDSACPGQFPLPPSRQGYPSGSKRLVLVDSEHYVYDGDQVVMTLDQDITGGVIDPETGYLQNRHLYGPGVDELLTDENFGGRSDPTTAAYDLIWAATDHLGSIRQLLALEASDSVVIEH